MPRSYFSYSVSISQAFKQARLLAKVCTPAHMAALAGAGAGDFPGLSESSNSRISFLLNVRTRTDRSYLVHSMPRFLLDPAIIMVLSSSSPWMESQFIPLGHKIPPAWLSRGLPTPPHP
jgi:hypothetical protein